MRAPLSRQLVIDAAREELVADGVEQLSLRGVARRLGVTAPALYAYVADRADLLAAVATEHFEDLVARFEAVDAADPLDKIRGLQRAYIDHALASPALFRLLFRYSPAPVAGTAAFPPAARAFAVASAATEAAIASGQLAPVDPQLASMTMWAAVHGVAEVLLLGFGFDPAAQEALVTSVIETVLAGQARAAGDAVGGVR
ncbi:MAG: TetR family transcriptional regulator [Acidimicrobiales bacterium]|nr:TetR family transcriptional regulator [Acidimicrobiales bacterium]